MMTLFANKIGAQETDGTVSASSGVADNSSGFMSYAIGALFTEFTPVLETDDTEEEAMHLVVYPNPFVSQITLTLSLFPEHLTTYRIFDVQGKLIKKGILEKESTEINLSYFAQGLYFVQVVSDDQKIQTVKLLKN